MKKVNYILLLATGLLFTGVVSAQLIGGKKGSKDVELDEKAAFDAGVQESRVAARAKLKPFKYDGVKSTYFNYKTFTHAKEVEILTVQNTNYKFSFNGSMIKGDNITVEIYDKPRGANGRTLVYSKSNIGSGDFEVTLDEMNDTFRSKKADVIKDEKLLSQMRLKKVYINYIIPASDREFETIETYEGAKEVTTIQYSAIVLAVGYEFL
jgi:hypothetical protein